MSFKKPPAGFTLLEVLVVLVLVGLITTLLMQSISFMVGSFQRVTNYKQSFERDVVFLNWYRRSISHMTASLDEPFAFVGSGQSIQGVTLSPILSEEGMLTKIRWELLQDGEFYNLWYSELNIEPMLVYQWRAKDARFSFRGANSNWNERWPVDDLPLGWLPNRVRINIIEAETEKSVYTAIKMRRIPRSDFRDLL